MSDGTTYSGASNKVQAKLGDTLSFAYACETGVGAPTSYVVWNVLYTPPVENPNGWTGGPADSFSASMVGSSTLALTKPGIYEVSANLGFAYMDGDPLDVSVQFIVDGTNAERDGGAPSDASAGDAATTTDASGADAGSVDAGPISPWSFMNTPDTRARDLLGVWGSSEDDVYVVGDRGAAYQSVNKGASWSAFSLGTAAPLFGVWGSSASNVYIVGGSAGVGNIYRYNGSTWSTVATTTDAVVGIWGSSATDIWAVGAAGQILHSTDGSNFSTVASGTTANLSAIWGSGPNDIYATGSQGGGAPGVILHKGAAGWSTQYSTPVNGHALNGVWGAGSNVFVSNLQAGSLLRTTNGGAAWLTDLSKPAGAVGLYGIWGSSGNDVYAAGATANGALIAHYNGAGTTVDTEMLAATSVGDGFFAIWGSSASDVYAVGVGGRIAHKR